MAIKRESRTLATITFQNYFRMYEKLAGMTGTAETEMEEFFQIYSLDVIVVPTNKEIARKDLTDRIYKNEKGKFLSVIEDVKEINETGQPILIGTASIEKNELVSALLTKAGIKHQMLNAKNHEGEAQIIAQAGRKGAVTVATNMAGRGVDIILGGNPCTPEEHEEILALGGLYVIGTERHESRRIDNQLRGRAGRQGDPGVTRFYVSLEDDLMRIFASDRVKKMMETFKIEETVPIESGVVTKSIERAQERVEGHHFDTRKHVLQYDDVLNKHRNSIYEWRQKVLKAQDDPEAEVRKMIEEEVERVVLFHTDAQTSDVPDAFADGAQEDGDWDPKEITEVLNTIVPLTPELDDQIKTTFKTVSRNQEELATQRTEVIEAFMGAVDEKFTALKEKSEEDEKLTKMMRSMVLRANDNMWVQHLDTMTYLRRSIGLRGYGQRDPLVEYKKESFGLFNQLQENIQREVVYNVFKVLEQSLTAQKLMAMAPSILERAGVMFSGAQKTMAKKAAAAVSVQTKDGKQVRVGNIRRAHPEPAEGSSTVNAAPKQGRNELCACGSGKKYKKCHGA